MPLPNIKYCPGTLAEGFGTYSKLCLNRMFGGKKVSHILQYDSPILGENASFSENRKHISLSGVQEKFSVILKKNQLFLTGEGEQGNYILKPIPNAVKNALEMPANEHLTMQIARQVFGIETAENALIFFKDGNMAYLTKRFDVKEDGSKLAQEDFAVLAGRTPQTHGTDYKYQGNYLELFELMKQHLPAYQTEMPKLFKLLVFNYLFLNGDAHFKNFSLLETPLGDYRLSPAYDLINSRIHIDDKDFALTEGLLPKHLTSGAIRKQFIELGEIAGIVKIQVNRILEIMTIQADKVAGLIAASYLSDKTKRNYLQSYQRRLKKLNRF